MSQQHVKAYGLPKKVGLILGPVIFLLINVSGVNWVSPEATQVISVAAWMVCWWITEAVDIPVTALLPMFLFPLLEIMPFADVAVNYGSPIIFLFFGGFILALAMEKVNLHKRIALNIIRLTGSSANGVILGFMLATALLSMWISNTATALVILPIALTMIDFLIKDRVIDEKGSRNFALATMLGIAYAANIGGTATVIGTPPNVVLIGFLESEYGMEMDFIRWAGIGFPFAAIMLTVAYFVLTRFYKNGLGNLGISREVLTTEIEKLGKRSQKENLVLICFSFTALLWIFRPYVNDALGINLSNSQIAIIGALLTFTIPVSLGKGDFALKWEDTRKLQWGILILFGGGLALAKGLSQTGIIDAIGNYVQQEQFSAQTTTPFLISVMLFMTELMSNVALVAVFAPMVSGISQGLGMEFLHLAIPITLASSCAFMLPMATPPNAIVFVSGYIKVFDMVKVGILLNVLAIVLLVILSWVLIPALF